MPFMVFWQVKAGAANRNTVACICISAKTNFGHMHEHMRMVKKAFVLVLMVGTVALAERPLLQTPTKSVFSEDFLQQIDQKLQSHADNSVIDPESAEVPEMEVCQMTGKCVEGYSCNQNCGANSLCRIKPVRLCCKDEMNLEYGCESCCFCWCSKR